MSFKSLSVVLFLVCFFSVCFFSGCNPSYGPYSGTNLAFSELTINSLVVGHRHNCAYTSAGPYCWGTNAYNEIGDSSYSHQVLPTYSNLLLNFSGISSGDEYNCSVLTTGGVQCWGYNVNGTLGSTAIDSQINTTCAGTRSCGSVTPVSVEQIGGGSQLASVSFVHAGVTHACAISTSGGLSCWGMNYEGQLGNNSTTSSNYPVQVSGLTSGVTQVSAGSGFSTCAIVSGAVYCWGDNTYGQVGDNSTTQRNVPAATSALTSGVRAIAVGTSHACAITSLGAVYCWGNNVYGQIGDGTATNRTTPVQATGITSGATALALGDYFSCAIVGGSVYCWGSNYYGQIGTNSILNVISTPTKVATLPLNVTSVGAGQQHVCAIASGHVYCWGDNSVGQLGTGNNINTNVPGLVSNPKH